MDEELLPLYVTLEQAELLTSAVLFLLLDLDSQVLVLRDEEPPRLERLEMVQSLQTSLRETLTILKRAGQHNKETAP